MRNAPNVPELRENLAATLVNGIGNLLPAGDLRLRMHAGRADVADALWAHLARFGDEETGGSALRVIGGSERIRKVAIERAAARHRREHQAIGEFEFAQLIRRKKTFSFLSPIGFGLAVAFCGGFEEGHG